MFVGVHLLVHEGRSTNSAHTTTLADVSTSCARYQSTILSSKALWHVELKCLCAWVAVSKAWQKQILSLQFCHTCCAATLS